MLQTLANLGEFLGGVAVIGGVIFAVIQVQQYQAGRQRESALELLRYLQTPEWAKALLTVYNMPNDLTEKKEIEEYAADDMHLVYALMTTWESLGILVYRGELSLDLVDDFFSGPITISWRKLKPYVFGEREEQNRETIEEWFEWLADRMMERESEVPPVPAHIAHKAWVQKKDRKAISGVLAPSLTASHCSFWWLTGPERAVSSQRIIRHGRRGTPEGCTCRPLSHRR